MCMTLALTVTAKVLPQCLQMVVHWHLPSHPFSSVYGFRCVLIRGRWDGVLQRPRVDPYRVGYADGNL